jgi:hypothetical protein
MPVARAKLSNVGQRSLVSRDEISKIGLEVIVKYGSSPEIASVNELLVLSNVQSETE